MYSTIQIIYLYISFRIISYIISFLISYSSFLFSIAWWIVDERFDAVCQFFETKFGHYVVHERQLTKMRIEISAFTDHIRKSESKKRQLGQMFGSIEAVKLELFIQDYSISQTSLEQIFNQFAAQQEEETGHAAGMM